MQKFIYELNSNEHDNVEVNRSTRHFATESNNVLLHRSSIKTFANTTHSGTNSRSLIVMDMTTLKLIVTHVTLPHTLIMCY
jgi:hypothetical protein